MVKTRSKERLTVQDLRGLQPNKIFTGGVAHINLPEGIRLARWVAVRSGSAEWTIFYGHSDKTDQEIRDKGWRLTDTIEIPKLVPCTAGAIGKYRLY
jgi:hypothetical protein